MLPARRSSSKPTSVIRLARRRSHRSLQSHDRHHPAKPDISPITVPGARIHLSIKINPTNDDKNSSSVMAVDHLSQGAKSILPKGSDERPSNPTRPIRVSRLRRCHPQLSESSADKKWRHADQTIQRDIDVRIPQENDLASSTVRKWLSTIGGASQDQVIASEFSLDLNNGLSDRLSSNRTGSTNGRHGILYREKKRKRRKCLYGHCYLCTPMCVILSVLGVLLLGIAIFAIIFLTKPKPTTETTTTTTSQLMCSTLCGTQTLIFPSDLIAKWPFEGNVLDETDNYNGTAMNNPSFVTNGYVNKALALNSNSNQYISTSYIPLATTSFTVEAWLYPTGFPNPTHHSIIGLCETLSASQCLYFTIRDDSSIYRLYMGFYGNDCQGTSSVALSEWIHAAFVFDVVTLTQSIYLNGILDQTCTATGPFIATAGNTTIGAIPVLIASSGVNYFQGYIDQLTIINQARSACQILEDATFAACFMFNNGSELTDLGPNALLSTASSVSFVSSGHSQQAVSFNGSLSSYFQVSSLTGLGTLDQPFTISLWIRPQSLSGIVVHVSDVATGASWCLPFIGFAANGSIVAQIWTGAAQSVSGPIVSTSSVWSQVIETWSSTNGLRLYVNNVLVATNNVSTSTYSASGNPDYVTLANALSGFPHCASGIIGSTTPFDGDIDDFRIYSRELTVTEVNTLYLM